MSEENIAIANNQLVDQISNSFNEIMTLLDTNDNALTQLNDLLSQQGTKLTELEIKNNELNQTLTDLQNKHVDSESSVAAKAQELEQVQQQLEQLKSQSNTQNETFVKAEEDYKKRIEELEQQGTTAIDLQKRITDTELKLSNMEQEKIATQNNIEGILSKIQTIKNRVQSYTDNFSQLRNGLQKGSGDNMKILMKKLDYAKIIQKLKKSPESKLKLIAKKLGINYKLFNNHKDLLNSIVMILHGQTGLIKNKKILKVISKNLISNDVKKTLENIDLQKIFKNL